MYSPGAVETLGDTPISHLTKLIVGPFECTRSLRYINNISHYVEGLDGDGRWVMEIELLLYNEHQSHREVTVSDVRGGGCPHRW
jgi:hypothetical protein